MRILVLGGGKTLEKSLRHIKEDVVFAAEEGTFDLAAILPGEPRRGRAFSCVGLEIFFQQQKADANKIFSVVWHATRLPSSFHSATCSGLRIHYTIKIRLLTKIISHLTRHLNAIQLYLCLHINIAACYNFFNI